MPFSTRVGNEPAKAALERMAEQKCVPSTLLFYGPDGVGKSLFALGLAELLMGPAHAPKLRSHNHPDLYTFKPEGKGALHPIENIRRLIDEAALPPFEAPAKIFILHDAHQMLPTSSNALLKILEEPPAACYFILLTSAADSLLPTIVSRCRKVPFFPIPQALIADAVKQKWDKSPEESRRIAFFSHGSLAKAEQLALHKQNTLRPLLMDILSLQLPQEYPQMQHIAAQIEEECKAKSAEDTEEDGSILSQADALLEEVLAYFRDLHLLKEGIAPEFLYHLDSIDRLQLALAHPIPPLEKVLEAIERARLSLQRHILLRTVLEQLLFKTQ